VRRHRGAPGRAVASAAGDIDAAEPVENYTNWGELDGRKLDFSVPADRVAACEWHIDQALKRWQALAPKHLVLAGFYFVPEAPRPATSKCSRWWPKRSIHWPAIFLDPLLAREDRERLAVTRL